MKQAIKAYRQLCRARQVAGLFVALLGTLVLLGWLLDVAALKSLLLRLETMKANTALCFLLAGLALWLWPKPDAEDWRRLAARVCAVLILLIGLLTLGEYVTGLNFGLDELLFRDEPLSPVTVYPGRMGPNTALGFVLGGAALWLAQLDGWRARWSQGCALLVGLLGFITLIGYGYSLIQLTRFSSSNSMALHTALGFLVLALGLLCLRPEAGVMALALSDGLAGMVLRRLLPLIFLLLIALDWLIEQGVRVGWYGAEWHRPLLAVAGVVVLSWLVWRNALALARLEAARDEAEREGHRLDEQMHVTLRSIGDAVIATDAAGRVTFLNEVAQTLTGWTAEQASGRPVTEVFRIINEATHATVESPVEKVLREGRIVGLANHTILVARDGRELPIDDSGAPIRDATGRITGVVLVFRDISERKEAEQARAHLAAIAESSQDAMVTVSLDGRFLTWNAGAEKMFGYTAEEVIGQPVMMFVPEDKQAEARQILERRARGETIPPFETVRRRRDGSLVDVSLAVSPLKDLSGKLIGSSTVLRNITERKQAEEKLHASEAQLAAEASALGRLNDASSRLWRMSGLQEGLDEMLAATIEMLGADFGNIQLLDAGRGVLRIVAQRGFKSDFLDFFREVTTGDDSACGRALRAGERTVVEDVETDAPYATLRAVARAAGYRAVQSTPLPGRDGAPLGMLSTHWRSPRRPSEQDLRRLDLYVRQAADFITRIRSEEALRASEERLRISQQAAQVGTFDWNIETGLNTWTPQLEAMYGLPPGGFAGTQPAWESLLHPADRAGAVAKVDVALRTGELTEGEWRVVWPDGSVHWLVGRFQAFKDSSGKAVRLIGVNLDITERKQAEEKLRASEERLRLASEAAEFGVYERRFDPDELEWSPPLKRIFGLPAEAPVRAGEPLQYVHPDDLERVSAKITAGFDPAGTGVFEDEHRIMRPDGAVRWIRVKGRTEFQNGRPQRAYGTLIDITERKEAEERLRESEERFSKAFRASPLVLTISSLETGELIEVNETFVNTTGYTREEAIGRTTLELGLWKKPAERAAEMDEVRRLGQVSNAEYTFRTRAGAELTGLLAAERIEIGGRPCALTVIQDITERKQAEEELRAAFEQAEAARAEAQFANQSKDEFLSVVTHELRSPLNAILGYARLARTSAGNAAEVIKHCNVIERAARTQQQLIDDLLDTARIVSGKLRLEVEPCDLRLVVEDALAVVRPAAEAKAITLGAQPDLSSVQLIADAARLQQVVWNLLQNAIKFTPAGGRVEVHLEADERRVCLSVSDNGKGIPPEFLPRIFDRFSQNDMSRSRRYGGLGLGLALVRQIVELHGGEVSATSDGEGSGATFTVTLPLRAPQPVIPLPAFIQSGEVRTDEAALPTDNLPSLEGLCILAADDQAEARELIATALRESGARVMAVSSGLEVLALLADPPPGAKPDILLLDISMPDEDGYSVLKRVRALEAERGIPTPERLPAIALTAHTRAQDRLDALAAGFQMHVGKPLELAELIVVIASIMSGRRK